MQKRNVVKFISMLFVVLLVSAFVTACELDYAGKTEPVNDRLGRIKQSLEGDYSFEISYKYMNMAINGMSQQTEQNSAKDGSFRFFVSRKHWDHRYDWENFEEAEYFYRYEDGIFVCYVKENGESTARYEITAEQFKEMSSDKEKIVGFKVLFPTYLKDLTWNDTGDACSFMLPVDKLLNSDGFLSVFINNAFSLCEREYDPALNLYIICTCRVEADSCRPIEISYDFSQIKPYVLSNGAQSAEYALETSLMHFVISFDYDLPQTVVIPETFYPNAQQN